MAAIEQRMEALDAAVKTLASKEQLAAVERQLKTLAEQIGKLAQAPRLAAAPPAPAAVPDGPRRQKYNRWAVGQIEAAMKAAAAAGADTGKLVEALVKNLAAVDPALLEPMSLELYQHSLDVTTLKIFDEEKLNLAKRLTDPAVKRKTLADF